MEKLTGEVEIEFIHKSGPGGKYFPTMVIRRDGNLLEAALSLHGFKYKEDSQKVIDGAKMVLGYLLADEDGTEL